jgi:hypothetical protein
VTTRPHVDLDALLCALVLAPNAFSRNKYYWVFEDPNALRVRRRAARVRGIIRQLTGIGKSKAEIVGERVLEDGQVLLRYRVEDLNYSRTAALSRLEAAALRFALHRAKQGSLSGEDREIVEGAISGLGKALHMDIDLSGPRKT